MSFRIVDWDKHYENNRSRQVGRLAWVSIPNRHDGEGYSIIMADERAPVIFTAWILLVQVASKCQKRGELVRDDGTAMTLQAIATKTRAQVEWFEYAIPVLMQVGWIQPLAGGRQVDVTPTSGGRHPDVSHLTSSCEEGREGQDGTGREGRELAAPAPGCEIPPVSMETAKTNAGQYGATPVIAENWWLDRDKVGWLCRGQLITKWQSDLTSYATKWRAYEAKNKASGKAKISDMSQKYAW